MLPMRLDKKLTYVNSLEGLSVIVFKYSILKFQQETSGKLKGSPGVGCSSMHVGGGSSIELYQDAP